MSKSAKWRERQKAYEAGRLHEWEAAREAEARTAPPATPQANPFDNYEAIRTPEAAVWSEDSRYMRWTAETNSMGSRLSHSRNRANPSN